MVSSGSHLLRRSSWWREETLLMCLGRLVEHPAIPNTYFPAPQQEPHLNTVLMGRLT